MRIRRYRAKNMQEAILKVKMDLGNEALILNTRKVREKGILNLFSKPIVEVLAAIDEYAVKRDTEAAQKTGNVTVNQSTNGEKPIITEKKDEKLYALENKLNNMESMLHKMYTQIQVPSSPKVQTAQSGQTVKTRQPDAIQMMEKRLLGSEVDSALAKYILSMVKSKVDSSSDERIYLQELYRIISEMLGKPSTIKLRDDGKPTVVIFLGPTGVGKTTTLAKIAAEYALNHKKNVGLITADTYRIAAVEQLKTYAEILGIPVSVVYTPGEIKDAIDKFSDKDLVLVDTAGRSHQNKAQFEELSTLVEVSNPDEVYLVLSSVTSMASSREILKTYNFLKDYKLIFTKTDETPVLGIILNIKNMTGKKISYITNGQNVPDDIEIANAEKITKNILGRMA